jgi:hypothetical protein
LLKCVNDGNWDSLTSFQEWHGSLDSVDVIGLKCIDGRCSVVALLYPSALGSATEYLLQVEVPNCIGPLQSGFWGTV